MVVVESGEPSTPLVCCAVATGRSRRKAIKAKRNRRFIVRLLHLQGMLQEAPSEDEAA
jgi:hypothetical protein